MKAVPWMRIFPIHDWITLAIQLAVDEVEDSFERIARLKKAETGEEVLEVCD